MRQALLFRKIAVDRVNHQENLSLPTQFVVTAGSRSFVLVRSFFPISLDDLQSLKRMPGIADVWPDRLIKTASSTKNNHNGGVVTPAQITDERRTTRPVDNDPKTECTIEKTCPNSGRTILWAQKRIDSDLALAEIKEFEKRIGRKVQPVKVAVVDTGFDIIGNKTQMASSEFRVELGHDEAFDLQTDPIGHGTAVAALIGGKDGLGVAPDAPLTVYKVTDKKGETSSAQLLIAIDKACEAGNKVINVSWGSEEDEFGKSRDEKKYEKFLSQLADRGCLILKATGNAGVRRTFKKNLDDNYLRVEASRPIASGLAKFSSLGEIAAPGDGVFTLRSSQAPKSNNACNGEQGSFVSGTSFSAPLTAFAANIWGILLMDPFFSRQSEPEQIALVNRVLEASTLGGTVNSLRATVIAETLVQNKINHMPSSAQLRGVLEANVPAICNEESVLCSNNTECNDALRDCVLRNRKIAALCPNSRRVQLDLVEVATKFKNFELAAGWIHRLTDGQPVQQEIAERISADFLKAFKNSKAAGQDSDLLKLIEYYSITRGLSKKDNPELLTTIKDSAIPLLVQKFSDSYGNTPEDIWDILRRSQLIDAELLERVATNPTLDVGHARLLIAALQNAGLTHGATLKVLGTLANYKNFDELVVNGLHDLDLPPQDIVRLLRKILNRSGASVTTVSSVIQTHDLKDKELFKDLVHQEFFGFYSKEFIKLLNESSMPVEDKRAILEEIFTTPLKDCLGKTDVVASAKQLGVDQTKLNNWVRHGSLAALEGDFKFYSDNFSESEFKNLLDKNIALRTDSKKNGWELDTTILVGKLKDLINSPKHAQHGIKITQGLIDDTPKKDADTGRAILMGLTSAVTTSTGGSIAHNGRVIITSPHAGSIFEQIVKQSEDLKDGEGVRTHISLLLARATTPVPEAEAIYKKLFEIALKKHNDKELSRELAHFIYGNQPISDYKKLIDVILNSKNFGKDLAASLLNDFSELPSGDHPAFSRSAYLVTRLSEGTAITTSAVKKILQNNKTWEPGEGELLVDVLQKNASLGATEKEELENIRLKLDRVRGISSMQKQGDAALTKLEDLTKDPDPRVLKSAYLTLFRSGDKGQEVFLRLLEKEAQKPGIHQAADVVTKLLNNENGGFQFLLDRVTTVDSKLTRIIIGELSGLNKVDPAYAPKVIALLDKVDPYSEIQLIGILGKMGKAAAPAASRIIASLDVLPNGASSTNHADAILGIGSDAVPALISGLQLQPFPDRDNRGLMARLLTKVGAGEPERVASALGEAIREKDNSPAIRSELIKVLQEVPTESALAIAESMLTAKEAPIRNTAKETVKKIKEARNSSPIIPKI